MELSTILIEMEPCRLSEFEVNGKKLFTTKENGVVLSKTTMKNVLDKLPGVAGYYYQKGNCIYWFLLVAYYVYDGKDGLATVLWSGRAKDITSEKMENILSIPGA